MAGIFGFCVLIFFLFTVGCGKGYEYGERMKEKLHIKVTLNYGILIAIIMAKYQMIFQIN